MKPALIGPSYNLENEQASHQRTIGLVPVPVEPGNERTQWAFRDVEGLVQAVQDDSWPELESEALWLFFALEADETIAAIGEPGTFPTAAGPLEFTDNLTLNNDDEAGSNLEDVPGDTLIVPFYSTNPIPSDLSWTGDLGGPTPVVTDVNPTGEGWPVGANRWVHFPDAEEADFTGWAGGTLTLYESNDSGIGRFTRIQFSAPAGTAPPVQLRYVQD